MNVVFLDFDGVLNSWRWFKDCHDQGRLIDTTKKVDPKAVHWLNKIVGPASAKVVVSSTWRLLRTKDELQGILAASGFKGEIIDCTPQIREVRRGVEIQAWLSAHPEVKRFVILDDGDDMEHLVPFLVQTSCNKGLKPKHVERALALLTEGSGT